MRALLHGVRTGTAQAAYVSEDARSQAIEAGAHCPAAALLKDLTTSAQRFRDAALVVPDHAWQQPVRVLTGAAFPAAQLLVRRLVEVEVHHVDLDVGYQPEHWPPQFAQMTLPEPMRTQRESRRSPART